MFPFEAGVPAIGLALRGHAEDLRSRTARTTTGPNGGVATDFGGLSAGWSADEVGVGASSARHISRAKASDPQARPDHPLG